MPALHSDRPFELKCDHCGDTPTKLRHRRDEAGKKKLGEYYSCRCYSLTVGIDRTKVHVNQTEEPTRPDLI